MRFYSTLNNPCSDSSTTGSPEIRKPEHEDQHSVHLLLAVTWGRAPRMV
jgi:hypothetical protein